MSTNVAKKFRASATVQVTVVISSEGAWGLDCPLSQIVDQATENVLGKLRQGLGNYGWSLVGEPKVKAIATEDT